MDRFEWRGSGLECGRERSDLPLWGNVWSDWVCRSVV